MKPLQRINPRQILKINKLNAARRPALEYSDARVRQKCARRNDLFQPGDFGAGQHRVHAGRVVEDRRGFSQSPKRHKVTGIRVGVGQQDADSFGESPARDISPISCAITCVAATTDDRVSFVCKASSSTVKEGFSRAVSRMEPKSFSAKIDFNVLNLLADHRVANQWVSRSRGCGWG